MSTFTGLAWRYVRNWIVWLDQVVNCATGGDPGETLSIAGAKAAARGRAWGVRLSRVLNWISPGHTDAALQWRPGDRSLRDD